MDEKRGREDGHDQGEDRRRGRDSGSKDKDAKGNVIVSVRVRPDAGGDKSAGKEWLVDGRHSLVAYKGREGGDYYYGEQKDSLCASSHRFCGPDCGRIASNETWRLIKCLPIVLETILAFALRLHAFFRSIVLMLLTLLYR